MKKTVYLICGSTGAGKTFYSKQLAQEKSAIIFSIDQWMKNLFWMDAPTPSTLEWALERVQRCENQIWLTALQILFAGQEVILDLGFSKKSQRDKFMSLASEQGFLPQLHFLDIPVEIRKKRVMERNKMRTATFEFEVNEETFDWMEGYFEPPANEVLRSATVINKES